jgi:amino acid transporter
LFSVVSWTFYLLTVLGLLVLRVKEPNLARPYKAWLITPMVFCAVRVFLVWLSVADRQVAMFLLLMPIFAAPWEALAALGTSIRALTFDG